MNSHWLPLDSPLLFVIPPLLHIHLVLPPGLCKDTDYAAGPPNPAQMVQVSF
jgi:hypothetical protein